MLIFCLPSLPTAGSKPHRIFVCRGNQWSWLSWPLLCLHWFWCRITGMGREVEGRAQWGIGWNAGVCLKPPYTVNHDTWPTLLGQDFCKCINPDPFAGFHFASSKIFRSWSQLCCFPVLWCMILRHLWQTSCSSSVYKCIHPMWRSDDLRHLLKWQSENITHCGATPSMLQCSSRMYRTSWAAK